MITKQEVDPEIAVAFAHLVGPGEQLGWTPAALLPEVAT